MSHSSRRALFYALLFLFLMLGTGIVLFSEGWRMDFPSFRVSKVGGIYVRSYPENANIFLNGKSVQNQSGFLSRGTLISDLFPKTYRLALTAPGYLDWNENVAVSPSLVANHKYAVLIPANGVIAASSTAVKFAGSQNGVVLETPNGEIVLNGKTIGTGKLIDESSDLQSIIFQTAKGIYEFENVPDGTIVNLSNILQKEGFAATSLVKLSMVPASNGMVFAASAAKVALIDINRPAGTAVYTAPQGRTIADAIALSPNTIAWARGTSNVNSSSVLFYDVSSGIIASTTIALGAPVKNMSWINGGTLGILVSNGSFYLYDTNRQNLTKMADDVRNVSATTDGSRIAALESRSLEIFTIGDTAGYYRFNLPDVINAQATAWYRDNDHLFINYSDHVAFLDLEDAGLANFATITSGTSPDYDPQANALYIINTRNDLLRFDFAK